MLNQSAEYALRAVLFVAQHDGAHACTAGAIAQAIGVPRNYLGKVLHLLTNAQVLTSVRGPHGGFRLARSAELLSVSAVVAPFQRLPARQMCLLGNRECDASNPCASHEHWQRMSDDITSFFRTTTVATLLHQADTVPPQSDNGTIVNARQ